MYEGDSIEKIYATVGSYRDILEGQNAGEPCPSCGSSSGHFAYCALRNRNTAEAQSAVDGGLTEADTITLHGLGVKW
jgi:hypothetical protein